MAKERVRFNYRLISIFLFLLLVFPYLSLSALANGRTQE
jgi:hypothetical protein